MDNEGNIYLINDSKIFFYNIIDNSFTHILGSDDYGYSDGIGLQTRFNRPYDLAYFSN